MLCHLFVLYSWSIHGARLASLEVSLTILKKENTHRIQIDRGQGFIWSPSWTKKHSKKHLCNILTTICFFTLKMVVGSQIHLLATYQFNIWPKCSIWEYWHIFQDQLLTSKQRYSIIFTDIHPIILYLNCILVFKYKDYLYLAKLCIIIKQEYYDMRHHDGRCSWES